MVQREGRVKQLIYSTVIEPSIFGSLLNGQILLVMCHVWKLHAFRLYIIFLFLLQVLTAQDLVDFSPVYRCLHIYSVLVCIKATLKRYFTFQS